MSFDLYLVISDEVKEIKVSSSSSFNYHTSTFSPYPKYTPDKAHDGDYDTWYSVEDGAVAGNFLKLYLGGSYKIGNVKVTSRGGKNLLRRLENTEVRVYMSSGDDETSVASCGEIHGTEITSNKKYSDYILHLMRNLGRMDYTRER